MIETYNATVPPTQEALLQAAREALGSETPTMPVEGTPTSPLTLRRVGSGAIFGFTVLIDSIHNMGGTPFILGELSGPGQEGMVRIEVVDSSEPCTPEQEKQRPVQFTIVSRDEFTDCQTTDVA